MQYETSDIRKNLKIEIDGTPFIVVDFQFVKPGKGVAFTRTRIKNMETGAVIDRTFRTGDKIDRPDMEELEMEYLFDDGEQACFMDTTTYEQLYIEHERLGDTRLLLKENTRVNVLTHGGRPLSVDLPNFVELAVTQSDPGVKGDTASGASKPATLETGAVVQVPLFVNEGDLLRIDTRTCQYVERVKR